MSCLYENTCVGRCVGQLVKAVHSSNLSILSQRRLNLIRVIVLSSSVLLMLPGVWGHSITAVEFVHLPAGLAAWQRHSLGIYRVCGPLSKLLYAMPAYLAGVRIHYPESFDHDVQSRRERELGRLFQAQNTASYHYIYRWSRLIPLAVMIFGGCLACEWSTRLFGHWPGVLSLCAWCWTPPILAHGSLVTSDVLSAVLLLLAARSFWSFLLSPCLLTTLMSGVSLGLAQATKFTLLILYPCWAILIIGRVLQFRGTVMTNARVKGASTTRLVGFALAIIVISVVVLDALYFFQDVCFLPAQWGRGLSSLTKTVQRLGTSSATAWLCQVPIPVPLEFLRGLDCQLADTERLQSAYLLGQTRVGGWWYWYAAACLIKLPLPVIVLFGLMFLRFPAAMRCDDRLPWACLALLLPATQAAVLIAATTGTGTNAAFRYLIPSVAMLCVSIGLVWRSGTNSTRSVSLILLVWLAANAMIAVPDHLGWQNELGWAWRRWTGKPALIGDSLDWGQDVARARNWILRHAIYGNTLVCLYGLGDAEPYGLRPPLARPIPNVDGNSTYLAVSEEILCASPTADYVSIGATPRILTKSECEAISRIPPFYRVGRTVEIYRLSDLPSELLKSLRQ